MAVINIVHLTDLHLTSNPQWDEQVLRDALIQDLKTFRFSQSAPGLVLFSGDLASSPDDGGAYEALLTYLLTVLDALGLDETRLIMCPGNHDASRNIIGPNLPAVDAWRRAAATTTGANALVTDTKFRDYVGRNFQDYSLFASEFGATSQVRADPFSTTYYVRDLGLVVAALNTATLTKGGLTGQPNEDLGALCLPERVLVEALDGGPKGLPAIALGHHPLNWLNQTNHTLVETILSKRAIAYFSGHVHESTPRQGRSMTGEFLHIQSGALFAGRQRWNGYALVSIETAQRHARISYRRWFEQRREFSKAEDLGTDGIFYSSPAAEEFWKARSAGLDPVALERWREAELLPALRKECNDCFSAAGLDKVFVPPDFDREVPYRTEGDAQVGSRVEVLDFEDIAKSGDNFVVSARSESGKTTTLKRLALELAVQYDNIGRPKIPVLLQFGSMRGYSAYIETLVRQKLPDLPGGVTVKSLLSDGSLVVLVDDVDFASDGKRKALVQFVSDYPRARYIFASSTTFVESSALRPEITPTVPFTRVRMRPLKQKQLLTLIEKHGTTDPLKADRLLERVVRDASALNVPLTAVTGTFLIQILNEDPEHLVLNQAGFVERYLEMVLEKYAPKELLPGTFDFKNKVDLLCTISEFMVRDDEYNPAENKVTDWCVQYLRGYGLSFSAKDLLTYFIQARVLECNAGCIRFRLRMFFEFFVATRMNDDNAFREFILKEENYLSFINEIGFYAALNRKDKDLVERILKNFKMLDDKAWSEELTSSSPDQFLEDFKVPGKATPESDILEIQEQIRTERQIDEDRATILGGVDLVDRASQAIVRPLYENDEDRWLGNLILLTGLVKNMELIPDWDKRNYLKEVLQGWVRVTVNSLGLISVIARDKKVVFNGITYRSTMPDNMPIGEVARRLALSMPIATARMASMFLTTEKLRPQLEEGLGSSTEPQARQFLRIAILADMAADGLVGLATRASNGLRGHRFLSLVLMRKLHEVAVRFRLPKREGQEVRSLVADMYVAMEQVPGKQVAHRRSEIIAGMERQRLRVEYRSADRGSTIIVIGGEAPVSEEQDAEQDELNSVT